MMDPERCLLVLTDSARAAFLGTVLAILAILAGVARVAPRTSCKFRVICQQSEHGQNGHKRKRTNESGHE